LLQDLPLPPLLALQPQPLVVLLVGLPRLKLLSAPALQLPPDHHPWLPHRLHPQLQQLPPPLHQLAVLPTSVDTLPLPLVLLVLPPLLFSKGLKGVSVLKI
jgi:hypothetical protein